MYNNNFLNPQITKLKTENKKNTLLKHFTWSKFNSMANPVTGQGYKTGHSAVTIKRSQTSFFEELSSSLYLLSLSI